MYSAIFQPSAEIAGTRLDKALHLHFPHHSRSYFAWLIEQGFVSVNGAVAKKRIKLAVDDTVDVHFVRTPEIDLSPEPIELDILYEDAWLIAVNKPQAMCVHPAPGNWSGTFVNALLFHCRELVGGDSLRPGIIHRLDKDTSGVLVAAKTAESLAEVSRQFKERSIQKSYYAVVLGKLEREQVITAPIGRHPTRRTAMVALQDGGREAESRVRPLASNGELSWVEVELKTGRTHQARVHLRHIGHPVLGDPLYGRSDANERWGMFTQMLHAHAITLSHPVHRTTMHIEAPMPRQMADMVAHLVQKRN